MTQPSVSFVPNINVCQSSDCTKLIITFDTIGMPDVFNIDDVLIDVYVNGTQTITALSIYDSLFKVLTGTGTIVYATNKLIGNSTLFETEVANGEYIFFAGHLDPLRVYQLSDVNTDTILYTTTYNWNNIAASDMILMHQTIELPYPTLGGTTALENGDYQINITYQLDSTYSNDINGSFRFSVCCTDYCCVYEKLADLANDCDDCYSQENVLNALVAWGLLQSAMGSAVCGNVSDSDKILQKLQRFCDNKPCNCKG